MSRKKHPESAEGWTGVLEKVRRSRPMQKLFVCVPGADGKSGAAMLVDPDWLKGDLERLDNAVRNNPRLVREWGSGPVPHIPGIEIFSAAPLQGSPEQISGQLQAAGAVSGPVLLTVRQAWDILGISELDCIPPGDDGHVQLLVDSDGEPWNGKGEPRLEVRFEPESEPEAEFSASADLKSLHRLLLPVLAEWEASRADAAAAEEARTRPALIWLPGGDSFPGILVRGPESQKDAERMLSAFAGMEAWAQKHRNAILDAPGGLGGLRSIPMEGESLFAEGRASGPYDPRGTELVSTGRSFDPRAVQILTETEAETVLLPCGPWEETGTKLDARCRQTFEVFETDEGELSFGIGVEVPGFGAEPSVRVQPMLDDLRPAIEKMAFMLCSGQDEEAGPRP